VDSTDYVIEKLTTTLEILTTHPGDARARLESAWLIFMRIEPDDLRDGLRQDWIWIQDQMTRFGPLRSPATGEVFRGSAENTMRRIRNTTASRIITRIWDIYWELSDNVPYA